AASCASGRVIRSRAALNERASASARRAAVSTRGGGGARAAAPARRSPLAEGRAPESAPRGRWAAGSGARYDPAGSSEQAVVAAAVAWQPYWIIGFHVGAERVRHSQFTLTRRDVKIEDSTMFVPANAAARAERRDRERRGRKRVGRERCAQKRRRQCGDGQPKSGRAPRP